MYLSGQYNFTKFHQYQMKNKNVFVNTAIFFPAQTLSRNFFFTTTVEEHTHTYSRDATTTPP